VTMTLTRKPAKKIKIAAKPAKSAKAAPILRRSSCEPSRSALFTRVAAWSGSRSYNVLTANLRVSGEGSLNNAAVL